MPGETCVGGACVLTLLPGTMYTVCRMRVGVKDRRFRQIAVSQLSLGSCTTDADCTMPGERCVSNSCTLVGPPSKLL